MPTLEANFDGLVGPTHNYAGLSPGNLASQSNRGAVSSPRRAALQGLAKAMKLAELGLEQHVLPPQSRPRFDRLRSLGFAGSDARVLEDAARDAPGALSAAYSASAMWAANAATVSPSSDTRDGRVHLTPANLAFNAHRALEAADTTRVLQSVFADPEYFVVHEPLPATPRYFDEGAANHTRLARSHDDSGVELFCYGRSFDPSSTIRTKVHPARQSEEASRAIARRHGVPRQRTVFAQQNPEAIDAGIFHNDVISVGNEHVLLVHEHAYTDTPGVIDRLRRTMGDTEMHVFLVTEAELPLPEATASYLFNSQLLTVDAGGAGRMVLIAPTEVESNPAARACADRLVAEVDAVRSVEYVDVRESMRNGGGPACLRLRVAMNDSERAALAGRTRLDRGLFDELTECITRRYREALCPADLADPAFAQEAIDAAEELAQILGLGHLDPVTAL